MSKIFTIQRCNLYLSKPVVRGSILHEKLRFVYQTWPGGYKTRVHSQTGVHKKPIIALYFDLETVLKFYNPKTRC